MNNTEKKPRITKSQRFEDMKALLMGDTVKYGTTVEDAVAVIDHEMELLAKKNAGDNKVQTATQKANEEHKEKILEFLAVQENGVTCSQIFKGIPALAEFSPQKVSALCRQLKAAGQVTSYEEKGKTLFKLA